jgi:hypothetical protein
MCDPEGGTAKNAAKNYELKSEAGGLMKTSHDFFAFCSGNLSRPDQSLVHKQGKGVFRRVFTFVPAAGEGAVNYKVPIFTGIKGSNSMHQFKDVGTPGELSTRLRSCHCPGCFSEAPDATCDHLESMLEELTWQDQTFRQVRAGSQPRTRGKAEGDGHKMALDARPGQYCAFYVHGDEAWMIGLLLNPTDVAKAWAVDASELVMSKKEDGTTSLVVQDVVVESGVPEYADGDGGPENWMGSLQQGDQVVYVQKLEAEGKGRALDRSKLVLKKKFFCCFSTDTRLIDVPMVIVERDGKGLLMVVPPDAMNQIMRSLAMSPQGTPEGAAGDEETTMLSILEHEEDMCGWVGQGPEQVATRMGTRSRPNP